MAEVMGIMWFQIQRVFAPEFNFLQINGKEWLQRKDPGEVSYPVFLVSSVELCWLWLPKG